jgi:hypothetical protein
VQPSKALVRLNSNNFLKKIIPAALARTFRRLKNNHGGALKKYRMAEIR